MQQVRSKNWFLGTFVLLALPACIAVFSTEQLELHRLMHPCDSPLIDGFFSYVTHLGDGLVPTGIAIAVLLLCDVRSFMLVGLGCSLSALVAQGLKRGPFVDVDRPFMFKEQLGDLHWVADVDLHHHLSFPSGHSTAAFSMCFALAILIARPGWSIALALLAWVIAYSRVYLSQHFTEDILAGATIGTITVLFLHQWLYRSSFAGKSWLDRRLLRTQNQ